MRRSRPDAGHHPVAVVRQQPRGSRRVLHFDFSELVDRGVRPLHRSRARARPATCCRASFVLDGTRFIGINGGPHFPFTEAVSFMVECKDQDEVDYYWDRLVDGGEESQCGWLKDRFGLSWQIVPDRLSELHRAIRTRPAPPPRPRRCSGCARSSSPSWRKPSADGQLVTRSIHSTPSWKQDNAHCGERGTQL